MTTTPTIETTTMTITYEWFELELSEARKAPLLGSSEVVVETVERSKFEIQDWSGPRDIELEEVLTEVWNFVEVEWLKVVLVSVDASDMTSTVGPEKLEYDSLP